jgi:toxin YoeB
VKILFDEQGWEDYLYWIEADRKITRKINALIKDITRDPFSGIGKPEPLKHQLSGFWSRRISGEHRLIYQIQNETVVIIQCRLHYEG